MKANEKMMRQQALQTAKPILFNTEMVRAIQNGTKTVTRRVIKPKYTNTEIILQNGKVFETAGTPSTTAAIKLPYQVGDILYVRETWAFDTGDDGDEIGTGVFLYKADGHEEYKGRWQPSIHMPKEAARIFLRITNVRVERLQAIDGYGVLVEGIDNGSSNPAMGKRWENMQRMAYSMLWNSTVKQSDLSKYGWNASPWVWVIEFERISKEEAYNG